MPTEGQTRTVKKMKEEIQQTKAKRSKSVDKPVDNQPTIHNSQVVNAEAVHSQPNHNPEVVQNTREHIVDKELKVIDKQVTNKLNTVLNNLEVSDFDLLIDSGLKPEQVEDALATLLPLFAAEGLKPSSRVLADSIRQLHRDAK